MIDIIWLHFYVAKIITWFEHSKSRRAKSFIESSMSGFFGYSHYWVMAVPSTKVCMVLYITNVVNSFFKRILLRCCKDAEQPSYLITVIIALVLSLQQNFTQHNSSLCSTHQSSDYVNKPHRQQLLSTLRDFWQGTLECFCHFKLHYFCFVKSLAIAILFIYCNVNQINSFEQYKPSITMLL